ncbi:ABC transporter permease [Chelatococcus asaccharovorans]|uniref:ABC transporter permease n=1 Tax=Chelatococcus asaccharovorans TaxID=28210 RepID=UPI00224C6655|nr:ABC transporter permease [Chelatococcus asaccharovorans]CAH1653264.1 Peptide/nickel transport system permease protein [Chelatococcus asaccharovorans]CAH1694017.1 Peptide/nickel transport system permease protein [Chelatococcus asaccharovorans]
MGVRRTALRHVKLAIGTAIITMLVTGACLSLVWTPAPPARMNILARLKPPFASGWLGTDQFGRDVTSLLMAGAWNSLSIAVLAVALGASAGVLTGLAAARRRGLAEAVLMRICDVIFAFPPVLSAMVLGVLMGTGAMSAILAIAVFMVPVFARMTRGIALQVQSRDYVLAARSIGLGEGGIMVAHVMPNIAGQIVVQVMIQLGLAILTEAGLSFLGLGLPPPAPTWGRMLAEAQTYLETAPWLALAPGLAIAFAVLGFSLVGDGLRDLFDPRDATL